MTNVSAVWVVGIVVLLAVIANIVLSARWNGFYFTVGLPIFWRRIDRVINLEELSLDDLQKSCATAAGTPILFRRLAPDVIAFREQVFGGVIHYTPIMHGVIRRRPAEATVEVIGHVKWWVVAALAWLVVITGRDFFEIALYPLAALAIIYFIQAIRYGRIAKSLRRTNTSPEGATAPKGAET